MGKKKDGTRPPAPLQWVASQNGLVPPGAIACGRERNNPITFIGRAKLKAGGETCFGRVVPTLGSCLAISTAMEHNRSAYEVLVNPEPEGAALVWQPDFGGHVPDTAIAVEDGDCGGEDGKGIGGRCFVGRAAVAQDVLVPGRVVPAHGAIHVGYDNSEAVREDYEVLCRNEPCSLKYLAAKSVRDRLRARKKLNSAKYLARITDVAFALEKIILAVLRKSPRRRESPEERLELPRTLSAYLTSPRRPGVAVPEQPDFNDILANCCPPEFNCCCQMWVEVTLQGLF